MIPPPLTGETPADPGQEASVRSSRPFLPLAAALLALSSLAAPARAQDDGDAGGDAGAEGTADAEAEAKAKADADLRERLKAKLKVSASVSGGVADVTYSFMDGTETDDFEVKGYDLTDVKEGGSWTLGAGSRAMGAATHKLELAGDFTIEADLVIKHNTPSAVLAFVLNKKVAVLWGQQIVKPGGWKPYDKKSAAPDVTIFREERRVSIKIERQGDTLKLEVNRRPAGSHTFEKGELDTVCVSVVAQNIRFLLGPLRIKGKLAP